MKIVTFNYSKANGETSSRVVAVTGEPSKFVSGNDITEMDPKLVQTYFDKVNQAKLKYLQEITAINDEFNVTKFRQFLPENMTDILIAYK